MGGLEGVREVRLGLHLRLEEGEEGFVRGAEFIFCKVCYFDAG